MHGTMDSWAPGGAWQGAAARGLGAALAQMDELRRWQGRVLDGLGLGPEEAPFRIVHTGPGMRLRRYAGGAAAGPVLLIVPAPIKRAYIWDLVPWASAVRRCLAAGVRVYLVEWTDPGPAEQEFGLAEYADRLLLDALDAVAAETGERRALLAGHSLGGTLAGIFAALHPQRLCGLVLLEAPLTFGPGAGVFAPLVAAAPPTAELRAGAGLGTVPGSFLDIVSIGAAPVTFVWSRWADMIDSLRDPQAMQTHLRVVRWTLDEFPLPGRLFEEVVERLYREDGFMAGRLTVGGRRAAADQVAVPLLNVYDPFSRIIPPESILPFHEAAPGSPKRLLAYGGDTGVAVQHVGVLVGANAHRLLWPDMLRWMDERWRSR